MPAPLTTQIFSSGARRHPAVAALRLLATAATLSAALFASAQTPVTVVEYYNKTIAAYFLTGRASEQAILDGIADFERTGMSFSALGAVGAPGALDPVCRYRIALNNSNWAVNPAQPFSSHFYGLPADCTLIANAKLANFFSEDLDFAVTRPTGGACPASAPVAVYRTLRKQSQVDVPNHRYAVDAATYAAMLAQGWAGEGVVFCVNSATAPTPRPTLVPSDSVAARCAAPRSGVSPLTGRTYPDRAGSLADELNWIRSYSDETYLWYRELPRLETTAYSSTASYFAALKSPAVTYSGLAKDKPGFHFTDDTADVESTNAGIIYGYGISWQMIRSSPPRQLIVAVVDPGSPADLAGVRRGDSVLTVDGVDLVNDKTQSGINTLNAGLFPTSLGNNHTLTLAAAGGGAPRTVSLRPAQLPLQPVPVSGTIGTAQGKVGYIAFTTFNSFASEGAIASAIAGLRDAGVKDLVLDLRYNGGGYLYIASQLGYMIGGPARTSGKTFEITKTNDLKPFGPDDVTPFYNVGSGRQGGVAAGQLLPTLNLPRVYVLTTRSSCSASEALINSLRGVDVEVILIGSGATCGKPFGFYGTDNCGTTYYTIQFTGVNARGEGDYVDGFAPTCTVADDLTRALGDPAEAQLATALAWRATGACGVSKAASLPRAESATPADREDSALAIRDPRAIGRTGKLLLPDDRAKARRADTDSRGGQPLLPRPPVDLGYAD